MSCYKIQRERDVEYWFPDVRIAETVESKLYDIAASYIARFCYWGIQTFKEPGSVTGSVTAGTRKKNLEGGN